MLTIISIFPISFLSFSGKDVPRDGKLSCVDANDNGKIFCQWKIDHVIVTWCHVSYIIFLANYHVFKWYFDLAFCESCVFVCSLSLPNNLFAKTKQFIKQKVHKHPSYTLPTQ